jgi:GNAT superfamily N-acetyltransferase
MPDGVPAALLGRLAVEQAWQGRGLGSALLRYAVLLAVGAAGTIGLRTAGPCDFAGGEGFCEHWGFRVSPIEPMTLMITVEEARMMLGRRR